MSDTERYEQEMLRRDAELDRIQDEERLSAELDKPMATIQEFCCEANVYE